MDRFGRSLHCLGGLLLAIATSCSSFTVRKIPWQGDYTVWNDAKQQEADRIEGERYYLPWPHLVIARAFPVAADSCFVSATLTSDGKRLELDDATLLWLNTGAGEQPTLQRAAAVNGQAAQLQASLEPLLRVDFQKPDSSRPDAGFADGGPGYWTTWDSSDGGGSELTAVGAGGSHPIPLSNLLSIEYLPNEKEQYAIQVRAGFSAVDAKVQLTNGWMAEAANERLGDTATLGLIQGVVSDVVPGLRRLLPGLKAQDLGRATPGATRVTVNVHTVRYALPGVYPLLHPDELEKITLEEVTQQESDSRHGQGPAPIPPCSPQTQRPANLRIGSFVVETYRERYLEIASERTSATTPESTFDLKHASSYPEAAPGPHRPPGRLVVRVLPWAQVFVDGRMVGTTPFEPIDVASGRHRIELINDELRVKRTVDVEVRAGETSTVQEKLEF